MKFYIVVHSGEGDVRVQRLGELELLKRLGEHYWGDVRIFTKVDAADLNLSERSGLLILRDEVVVPEPKEVVKEWRL